LVVLALSVNARDAMPHGGRLRWDASNIAADGRQALYSNEIPAADYIALGVADSGHGIPANLIDRVFEPLFSTKSERGSGTGLMTVYCALEQMNGQILIESEIDTGTLVRLFLPRADLLRL
jgi:signal transduction histidine kinase